MCFFFSSRRRHTRCGRDWSSDVCSSDLNSPGNYSFETWNSGTYITRVDNVAGSVTPAVNSVPNPGGGQIYRSEERRVGKECIFRRRRDKWKLNCKRTLYTRLVQENDILR